MKKIIMAAKAANNVIGKENSLPWHLPADLDFFLQTIAGQFLIAGRKFFESAQGREVFHKSVEAIIISRDKNYQSPHRVAHSIESAFQMSKQTGVQKVYILGGGEIYKQTIAIADRLIITEIHANCAGDTFFPEIDRSQWEEVSRIDYKKDAINHYDYSFVVYETSTAFCGETSLIPII